MRSPLLAAATLCLGFSVSLHAQEAPSPGGPPPASSAAPQPVQGEDVQTLKVNVNLVNVYFSVHDKLRQEAGRKILVLLTDGGDQGSQETLKTSIEAAQKANAIVYVILIADNGFYGSFGMGYSGAGDMDRLAKETGGRVINVGNNGKKLQEAFDQIQDELRTQYLASYTPTNLKADGTFRTLNISCQAGQKIQARKGYYAMADALGNDN